jgi:hypothetical protein
MDRNGKKAKVDTKVANSQRSDMKAGTPSPLDKDSSLVRGSAKDSGKGRAPANTGRGSNRGR